MLIRFSYQPKKWVELKIENSVLMLTYLYHEDIK